MYGILTWLDHAITPDKTYTMVNNGDGTVRLTPYGTVIQQGTNLNAANFNRMEEGILDASLAATILGFGNLQQQRLNDEHQQMMDREVLGEAKTVTLTNSASFPFNSTMDNPVSVALSTTRKNLFYSVEAAIDSHVGEVGDIHITSKALNGFKVSFDGSATSVTLTLRIKGGMT